MVLADIIGGFIVVLIGTSLMPSVAEAIWESTTSVNSTGGQNPTNVTGVSATLIGLSTLFFALGIMSAGVAIATNGLRKAGMF